MTLYASGQNVFYGRIVDRNGQQLPTASVLLVESQQFIPINRDAQFQFDWPLNRDSIEIRISLLGYSPLSRSVRRPENSIPIEFELIANVIEREEVVITASRMTLRSPGTYTNLEGVQLRKLNLGQDIPYQLRYTPSLVATSDAGAGVGYTGLRIRGSDQTRINVTINGIPINDSESQGVFWVNMPDLASSLTSAQIQRGLGTSANGSSAFGASINLLTTEGLTKAGGSVATSFGSFNTQKLTAQVQTGQLSNGFSAEARISNIQSDGYVDRSRTRSRLFARWDACWISSFPRN